MAESLLDIVFIEDEIIERNILGYKLGSRSKRADFWGRERQVVYQDEFGHVISTAKEIHPLFGGSEPYVEFYDKDKRPVGRAYVTEEILSGKRKVEYANNKGDRVASDYVDEHKVKAAERQRIQAEKDKNVESTRNFEPATPLILVAIVFLGIAINALLGFMNAKVDVICHYGSLITMYLICPLMVVLFLLLCRIKNKFGAQRLFWVMHLLVYAAGFAFVAYMADCFYKGQEPAFLDQIASNNLKAIIMFLLCYVPIGVLGIFSGICTLLFKRLPGHKEREKVSRCSMAIMKIGNVVLVTISMAVMILADAYGSGGVSGVISVIFMWLLMTVFLGIVYVISAFPYMVLSNRF